MNILKEKIIKGGRAGVRGGQLRSRGILGYCHERFHQQVGRWTGRAPTACLQEIPVPLDAPLPLQDIPVEHSPNKFH